MRLTAFIRLDHDTKCVVTGYIQSLCNTAGQEENEGRRRGGGEEEGREVARRRGGGEYITTQLAHTVTSLRIMDLSQLRMSSLSKIVHSLGDHLSTLCTAQEKSMT